MIVNRRWNRQPLTNRPQPDLELLGSDALVWSAPQPLLLTGARQRIGTDVESLYRPRNIGVGRTWQRTADSGALFGTFQHVTGNEYTVAVVAAPVASAGRKCAFSQRTSGSNAAQYYCGFNTNASLGASSGEFTLAFRSTTPTAYGVSALSQFDGTVHCWVAGSGASTGYIYRDGAAQTLNSNVRTAGTTYVNTQVTRIANIGDYSADGAFVVDDPMFLVIVWPRVIEAALAQFLSGALVRNLGVAFAPRRVFAPFSVASGIPVLSAATVTSITATTATPRVTVTF
jgi:hypothetical protein